MRRSLVPAVLVLSCLPLAGGCSSDPAPGDPGGHGGASSGIGGGGGGEPASSSTGGAGGGGGGAGGGGGVSPPKPPELVDYVTGNDGDADVAPAGPGLVLMGGGTDVDAAFQWWTGLLAGGDV